MAEENQEEITANEAAAEKGSDTSAVKAEAAAGNGTAAAAESKKRPHRSQKVGVITSDKMQQTVVVRVDRLVRHTKYRRYVRRTSKFMAHDEMGATIGDKVRIVETRPMSARKRWRVIEIVQKAAK
ncbi:MAG TPA: 30S ribosomal protein S17 [Pyrinomonadaceae bacterium]|nr:30S ribosomal protein S17 [Pyrinomonadaceae bacterium]